MGSITIISFLKPFLPIAIFLLKIIGVLFAVLLLCIAYVITRLKMNPFTRGYRKVINLRKMDISNKLLDFIRWVYIDVITFPAIRNRFSPYGFTIFCGQQGAGKTTSMIHYANKVHFRYPKCLIVSNFQYKYANIVMKDWRDLLTIRNGRDGVLFLIDEIHSEYSSADWKDFPESLLSEISQQRKQKVKICATSQVYSRVVKPIREQTSTVVQCFTLASRWTFCREYESRAYELYCDSTQRKKKLKPIRKYSFIQDDFIRGCFNTYEKIKRMKKIAEKPDGKGFIKRNERAANT